MILFIQNYFYYNKKRQNKINQIKPKQTMISIMKNMIDDLTLTATASSKYQINSIL